jgi:hypothetical protein
LTQAGPHFESDDETSPAATSCVRWNRTIEPAASRADLAAEFGYGLSGR